MVVMGSLIGAALFYFQPFSPVPADRGDTGLEDVGRHGDRRYVDPDTRVMGYPRLDGDASPERAGLVALL